MARKIFVSYKHDDNSVAPIGTGTTARTYVDELIDVFEGDEIYKGERNEDLSKFKNETIESHLRDKIYDSSITIVLISPNMKDDGDESEQWIPWEISYSLKEITRNERTSQTNAVLAIVLPDNNNSYEYFIKENTCEVCHCRTLCTDRLFRILQKNMFNIKQPEYCDCQHHFKNTVFIGYSSYIFSIQWSNFIGDKEKYIKISEEICEKIDDYNILKL